MAGVLKTRFEYGDDLTAYAGSAITAARLVTPQTTANTQGKPTVDHTSATIATARTQFVYGAAKRDAALGDDVTVVRRGTVMLLEADAAIASGAMLNPGTAGRVITDDATTAGRYIIGRALHAAAGQGSFVWCIVSFPGYQRG